MWTTRPPAGSSQSAGVGDLLPLRRMRPCLGVWQGGHQRATTRRDAAGRRKNRCRCDVLTKGATARNNYATFWWQSCLPFCCPNVRHTSANPLPAGAGGGTPRGIAGNSAQIDGYLRAAGEDKGPSRQRRQPNIPRVAHRTGQAAESWFSQRVARGSPWSASRLRVFLRSPD